MRALPVKRLAGNPLLSAPGGRVLLILLAGVLAHGGCLFSTFYLDDWWQIHDSRFVEGGRWWGDKILLLTHLSYYLTWRGVGFASWAFHLGNLLLHLVFAVSIYGCGWRLLAPFAQSAEKVTLLKTVAWVAALIFVVHPLTTEVTHYARARDHGMVGFFSFLVAIFTMRALKEDWRWGFAAVGAAALTAFSKGPGIAHAVFSCGLVLGTCSIRTWGRAMRAHRMRLFVTAIPLIVFSLLVYDHVVRLFFRLLNQLTQQRFGLHALTQARVFWRYAWRILVPTRLCSDHLVAWTRSLADIEAWICGALLVVVVAGICLLWWKRRQPWALLTSLAMAPLLVRWLYVVSELMVEYRVYPAMPYVAFLLAWPLTRGWKAAPRAGGAVLCLVLLAFAGRSVHRSRDWRSAATLHTQILDLYPLQLRAMNGLSAHDLRQDNYAAILERYPEFMRRLQHTLEINRTWQVRYYENWPLWVVAEECMVSLAIAHVHGVEAAWKHHHRTADQMHANEITHSLLWGFWNWYAAKIALMDKHPDALHYLLLAREGLPGKLEIDREIKTLDPSYPLDAAR